MDEGDVVFGGRASDIVFRAKTWQFRSVCASSGEDPPGTKHASSRGYCVSRSPIPLHVSEVEGCPWLVSMDQSPVAKHVHVPHLSCGANAFSLRNRETDLHIDRLLGV